MGRGEWQYELRLFGWALYTRIKIGIIGTFTLGSPSVQLRSLALKALRHPKTTIEEHRSVNTPAERAQEKRNGSYPVVVFSPFQD